MVAQLWLTEHYKDIYPGRFSHTCPAAIELHVTLDLKKGCFERASITPDSYSERNELPTLASLEGQLLLADRGDYLSKNATRSHPKRDRIIGVLQYGLEPIIR